MVRYEMRAVKFMTRYGCAWCCEIEETEFQRKRVPKQSWERTCRNSVSHPGTGSPRLPLHHHAAITVTTWPVMYFASAEARNATAVAMSSASPIFPAGFSEGSLRAPAPAARRS